MRPNLSRSANGARAQLQKFRCARGQMDVVIRKMTPISSNVIGQILVCFQYRPMTYLYVSQMEIIFRLWNNSNTTKSYSYV